MSTVLILFFFVQVSIAQPLVYELKILTAFEKFIFEKETSKFSKHKVKSKVEISSESQILSEKAELDYKLKCYMSSDVDTNRFTVNRENKNIYSKKSKNTLRISRAIRCGDFYLVKITLFYPQKREGIYFIILLNSENDKLEYKKYNYVF